MQFVPQNTSLRVPKLIRSCKVRVDDLSQYAYVVMEYIRGKLLSECWDDMPEELRQTVGDQVVNAIDEMQSVKLDRPGPIGGGVSRVPWFSYYNAGPFATVSEMEEWFTHKLNQCERLKKAPQDAKPFAGTFGKMVMSHMDISPRSIILERDDKICLIDWGYAGGYPVFCERAGLVAQIHFPDFSERILAKLPPYEEDIKALARVDWALQCCTP